MEHPVVGRNVQGYIDRIEWEPMPSTFWYEGGIEKFFDNYVIPLANKLKDCNVFGVQNSDECLSFAKKNRAERQERGQENVARMRFLLFQQFLSFLLLPEQV
eukprot:scaffold1252_cov154-Amphora_coffeaeformis.AAC.2